MTVEIDKQRIQSMVSLLGDRSVRVRNRVATQLENAMPGISNELQEMQNLNADPLIRERLGAIIAFGVSKDPSDHWMHMTENMCFNLRDGMASLCLTDTEQLCSRELALQRMDELVDRWFGQINESFTEQEKVDNLMNFLFKEEGFEGNSDNYYSLDNCYLHRVLESKKGLPVTLSILAVLLAEEAGLPLYGIGLPLHFIVGHFQGSKGIRFFDCFDSGREVTQEECVQYLHSRGIFFHPQLLSPCENESVLNRVLVNIKHIAQRRGLSAHLRAVEELSSISGYSE